MNTSSSPRFTPVPLAAGFNTRRGDIPRPLRPPEETSSSGTAFCAGSRSRFGPADGPNAILVETAPVRVDLVGARPTYLVFVHTVADIRTTYRPGLADTDNDGRTLGGRVSEYVLHYADGTAASVPIPRRFAIQQTQVQPHGVLPAPRRNANYTSESRRVTTRRSDVR
jgi:hypothetical protein